MRLDIWLIVFLFEVIVLVGWGGWQPTTPPYIRVSSLALLLLTIATMVMYIMGARA